MNTRPRVLLSLDLDQVVVPPDRLREVDLERAKQISVSMADAGQITPIEVTAPNDQGKRILVAGAHRIFAARLAGLTTIDATEFDGDAVKQRLREIDENLYRRELEPLDQAIFLAERRRLFQMENGQIKPGRKNDKSEMSASSQEYTREIAEKFGLSAQVIARAQWRMSKISEKIRSAIRVAGLHPSGAELDALAALGDDIQQRALKRVLDGSETTIRAALKVEAEEADEDLDKASRFLKRLVGLYANAPDEAKRQFCDYLVAAGHLAQFSRPH